MLEAEATAAACCIQRMTRQAHTEGQQSQAAELLHRKRHERQQISLHVTAQQPSLDAAFEAPDPSRRSDPALTSKAHLGQRPPAETLLKHEEHRGVQLEERLRELQVWWRPLARATPGHVAPLSTCRPLACATPSHAAPLRVPHPSPRVRCSGWSMPSVGASRGWSGSSTA